MNQKVLKGLFLYSGNSQANVLKIMGSSDSNIFLLISVAENANLPAIPLSRKWNKKFHSP